MSLCVGSKVIGGKVAQNSDSFIGPIIVVGFIWLVSDVGSIGWFNQGWYSVRYFVPPNEVHVDARPQDCDFMHAPLGSKGCHYEAVVAAYNSAGDLLSGDRAPKYGHDSKTGKPIISWDQGKTWTWMVAAAVPDQKVKSVNVSWMKIVD